MICGLVGSKTIWSITRSSPDPKCANGTQEFPPSRETNNCPALVPRKMRFGSLGSYARHRTLPPSGPIGLQSEATAVMLPSVRTSVKPITSFATEQTKLRILTTTSPLCNLRSENTPSRFYPRTNPGAQYQAKCLLARPACDTESPTADTALL